MRVLWSALAVVVALNVSEASAANRKEGAIHLQNGIVDEIEQVTVWRREVGESAPIVLAEARKAAKRGSTGAASTTFDGRWSVVIGTRSGPCDQQYRFGVRITNGNITYEGGGAANAQGRVSPSGTVTVSVSSGPQAASGQGRLSRDHGGGTWRGRGPGGVCSGTWQASRQS